MICEHFVTITATDQKRGCCDGVHPFRIKRFAVDKHIEYTSRAGYADKISIFIGLNTAFHRGIFGY